MKHGRFMVLTGALALTAVGAFAATAAPAMPHFKLIEPVSWIVENDRGDPQKAGPCGGTNTDWGKETLVVNQAKGGEKMHIKLLETVYHPGHFRVALAVNSMNELPPDPVAVTKQDSARGALSVSAPIQDPAVAPVLADGLFDHHERPAAMPVTRETDVVLPNLNCDHCVLQVIQFMEEHALNNPGGYTYHHCAIVHITADPSKPLDTRWPAQRATNQ
jgi:hypothetical protein